MAASMVDQMDCFAQSDRRWRVMDAADILEPGRAGSHWNLHHSLRLPDPACDHFEVSDQQGGESFVRLPVRSGDVVIAGRGHAHRKGIACLIEAKADVVVWVRFRHALFEGHEMERLSLLEKLRGLKENQCGEWSVSLAWEGGCYKARLCAARKSALHAALARKKAINKSRRKGRQIKPLTQELTEYILVLTTRPKAEYPARDVLEIYRCRWQLELAFKRLKRLPAIGYVPKADPDSSRGWMQGKILAALLVDKIQRHGRFFPRGASSCNEPSVWRCSLEVRDPLVTALTRPLVLRHLLMHSRRISLKLGERRPKRQLQANRFHLILS
jgi:hypothetical protein